MSPFIFSTEFPFPAEAVLAWHQRKGASLRCMPPWCHSPVDQVKQNILPLGSYGCILTEETERENLIRLFSWRHAALNEDLKLYHRYAQTPLRILLSGSRGLIGSHLKALLEGAGHTVVPLMRGVPTHNAYRNDLKNREFGKEAPQNSHLERANIVREQGASEDENFEGKPTMPKTDSSSHFGTGGVFWDPNQGTLCKDDFEDFDAIVHLAGESIAGGRWTKKRKETIFLSRCRDTWLLSQVLCRLYRPPRTLIAASAIGFYGNRGYEALTEESPQGCGFMADLCTKWERATDAIEQRGTRVVRPRFGMVLSSQGGGLAKLLLPYRLGLGGRLGSGEQIVSWIGIDDAVGALYHVLMEEALSGPVNIVSPSPVPQKVFAETLAKRLHRVAWMPLPKVLLRCVLGELADEVLLASTAVQPKKLLESGYAFRHPDLASTLHYVV